jgi:hypothetical protein
MEHPGTVHDALERAEEHLLRASFHDAEQASLQVLRMCHYLDDASNVQAVQDRAAVVLVQALYETERCVCDRPPPPPAPSPRPGSLARSARQAPSPRPARRFGSAQHALDQSIGGMDAWPVTTLLLWLSLALDTDQKNDAQARILRLLQSKAPGTEGAPAGRHRRARSTHPPAHVPRRLPLPRPPARCRRMAPAALPRPATPVLIRGAAARAARAWRCAAVAGRHAPPGRAHRPRGKPRRGAAWQEDSPALRCAAP